MRFDPRRRLDRRVPGADVHPGEVFRLHLDEERGARPDPVPARDTMTVRTAEVRPSRRLAQVGPYAPQLIRLIRTPYAMSGVRGQRQVVNAPAQSDEPRPKFGDALRAAAADWPEVGSPSPVQARPRAFAVRPLSPEPLPPLAAKEPR
ncbi:hypothetical protein LBMAG42_25710 [Deltaproteobacteria bacterium]|nr:hypothetical protein LBMAG42_25710 [Deltaproteobacteria bacterium]